MHCSQFRNHYSELRDGRIHNDVFRREMEAHLHSCASCANFHETLEQGVSLIYSSGEILVPPGFKKRIIKGVENSRPDADSVTPAPAGFAAALMVAAAIALVVFKPGVAVPPQVEVAVSQPAAQIEYPHFEEPRVIRAPYADFTEFGFRRPVNVKPIPMPELEIASVTPADSEETDEQP